MAGPGRGPPSFLCSKARRDPGPGSVDAGSRFQSPRIFPGGPPSTKQRQAPAA